MYSDHLIMKNIHQLIIGLALCLLVSPFLWSQSSPNCFTASDDDSTSVQVIFNHGSVSEAFSGQKRISYTIGQPVVGAFRSQTHEGGMGLWARLLAPPIAPLLTASEGDFEDHVTLRWTPDPLSPSVNGGYRIYRDGSLLATLDEDAFSYVDFNVVPGKRYNYEVSGINEFGEGRRASAYGFLNPNGVVTGQITSNTGNPVANAVVTLIPTIGTAASFDGTDAMAFTEYDSIFPRSTFTLSCWVKWEGSNDGTGIFDFGSHLNKNWWLHTLPTSEGKGVRFEIGGNTSALDYVFPNGSESEWHYIAATYNGSTLILYADGELIETTSGTIEADSSQLFFGRKSDGTDYYNGLLDDVRFYNQSLSQTELETHMLRTVPSDADGLVAYWKFDEGIGSKAFDQTSNRSKVYFCGAEWSDDRPDIVNTGITNESGFYQISGVYYGSGATMTATPSKEFHFNQALRFNAANGSYADLTDFDLPDQATVSMTVRAFDFGSTYQLMTKAGHFNLWLDGGTLNLTIGSEVLVLGQLGTGYHHLAMQMDWSGGNLAVDFFKDGSQIGSKVYSSISQDWTGTAWKVGSGFTGLVDEVAFFDEILTTDTIAAYATDGTNASDPKLSSYFNFNEGGGSRLTDRGTAMTGEGTAHHTEWSTITAVANKSPHEFNPPSRLVTLNPSITSVDAVDFIDISTIPVSGFVRYEETDCFAKLGEVEILVNGQSYEPRIFTDENGRFSTDFEPGSDVVLTAKNAVRDSVDYNPPSWELENLNTPVAGVLFQDATDRKIIGKIGGGECLRSIVPNGSMVKLKVATLNGCFEKEVTLSPGQVNFTIEDLPPDSVTISVAQHSDPAIYDYFQTQGGKTIDLSSQNDSTTAFIWYAPPQVQIGALPVNACGEPMLVMGEVDSTTIRVFEDYFGDTCYVDTALLSITNGFGDYLPFDTLIVGGELNHVFTSRFPNIVSPYKKLMQVTATNTRQQQATATIEAVVTGARPRPATFVTTAPETPEWILRDPPGDNSYAFFETEKEICKTETLTTMDNGLSIDRNFTIHLGWEWEVDVNIPFTTLPKFTFTRIFDIGISTTTTRETYLTNESRTCTTFTKNISTGDNDVVVGSEMGGDVFIGGAKNYVFTITDLLIFDEDDCSFGLDTGMAVRNDEYATTFAYTENHIRNIVIPTLDDMNTEMDSVNARRWERILERNDSLKAVAKFEENVSFGAGVAYENSVAMQSDTSVAKQEVVTVEDEILTQWGLTVNTAGVQGGFTFVWTSVDDNTTVHDTSEVLTVGYHLEDDDLYDYFSVDIKKDNEYGTPVFDLKSGRSSCPHEPNTQHREEVSIQTDQFDAINVNANEPAVFQLTLGNTAPSLDLAYFELELVPESNPHGAVVKVNGSNLTSPIMYQLQPNVGLPITLTIERGPIEYSYDSLKIALRSICEWEQAMSLGLSRDQIDEKFYKEIKLNVDFIEPCSEVDIGFPQQDWVLTPAMGDSLNITLNDYDKNDDDLTSIRVQYRRIPGNGSWQNIQPNSLFQKTDLGDVFTNVIWDTQSLQDGDYEIRAITNCTGPQSSNPGISHVIKGKIERTPPEVFGTPEPADGVLSIGDEISITFTEQIDCEQLNGVDNVKLKYASTGDLIQTTFSCLDNKIIIVPTIANHFMENQELVAVVEEIPDLAGNELDSITWKFTVDRNPLRWKNAALTDEKYEDESKTIQKEIVNMGSTPQDYDITGIPDWMTVFPVEGTLAPGEQQAVTFEFENTMIRGLHIDTVYMEGLEGDEPLPINFRVLCRPPEWDINPADFIETMNFSLQLNIEGDVTADNQDIVGAFIDGELRGMAYVEYVPAVDLYEAFLTVYRDTADGTTVEFQIWDASECLLYGDILETYTFDNDGLIGLPNDPDTLHTNSLLLRQIPLHSGWNWISFNLAFPDYDLDSALASLNHPQNDLIKSIGQFANYEDDPLNSWSGGLMVVNNTAMFQYRADTPDTIDMVGAPIDPLVTPIPIVAGWNHIGYVPQQPMPVGEALASLNPAEGDLIKSQTAFAQYITGLGWLGNLHYMEAPAGYILKISNAGTLTYPQNITGGHPAENRNITGDVRSPWTINPADFEHSMVMVCMYAEDGDNRTKGSHVIGAFADDEMRGYAPASYIEELDVWVFYLTVFANGPGEQLRFELYDEETDAITELQEVFLFDINGQVGTSLDPTPFTQLANTAGETTKIANHLLVQPNPFQHRTLIRLHLERAGETSVKITDALGHVVEHVTMSALRGWNNFEWEAGDLPSGIYFLTVDTGQGLLTEKLLLE